MNITYLTGDATRPIMSSVNPRFIAHICNNVGAWGRGFVLAISKRWTQPERSYAMLRIMAHLNLGDIQVVPVSSDILVVNMIAQNGIYSSSNERLVDYQALRTCLQKVATIVAPTGGSVHMPRIGCGLGGGDWNVVERIVGDTLNLVPVYVYDKDK